MLCMKKMRQYEYIEDTQINDANSGILIKKFTFSILFMDVRHCWPPCVIQRARRECGGPGLSKVSAREEEGDRCESLVEHVEVGAKQNARASRAAPPAAVTPTRAPEAGSSRGQSSPLYSYKSRSTLSALCSTLKSSVCSTKRTVSAQTSSLQQRPLRTRNARVMRDELCLLSTFTRRKMPNTSAFSSV